MSEKFRLLIDMDDVLENLLEVWLELLKFMQRNNPNYVHKTFEEIDSWDICSHFPMLTVDEVFAPLNTDIIWTDLIKPIPGAIKSVKKYNDMPDVDVRIVSSSHYTSIHHKREFLRKYFSFIRWDQVIITKEKQFVSGDALVDDYEGNLIGGRYKGVLFDQPHSCNFDESQYPDISRAKGWEEAEKIIDKMIEEFRDKKKHRGAKCGDCGQYMLEADGCTCSHIKLNGKTYERIKCGEGRHSLENIERCGDCGAKVSHYHHGGCDLETCPRCGMQLISCDCE